MIPNEALFLHLHSLLANESSEVVHASPHGLGLLLDLDLGNVRAVNREYFFNAFTVGNATNRECLLNARTLSRNYDARENLDATLVTFSHQRVHFNTITYLERGNVSLELVLIQIFNNLVHYINPLVNPVFACAFSPPVPVDATSRFLHGFRTKEPPELAYLETPRDA